MDSFNKKEAEEILEEEITEETPADETDDVIISDDDDTADIEEEEVEEEIKEDAAALLKASVASKKASAEKSKLKTAPTGKSSKYAGLYDDGSGKGAVIPEPVAAGSAGALDKQLKNVDGKRSGKTEDVQVHMDAMFSGEELSEEFKSKASTIFETALAERVEVIEAEIKTEYDNRLIEQTETLKADMTQQLDSYLSYVVEEWMEENKLTVEKGLRTEIAEEFIEGLRGLFLKHNIEVPQGKTDILDEMATQVEALTDSLNEELNKTIALKEQIAALERNELVSDMTEGLADTDKERFLKLSEGVGFDNNNEFRSKLEVIRESYFGDSGKSFLSEEVTDDMTDADTAPTNQQEILSESMEAYSQMLSRLNKGSKKTI